MNFQMDDIGISPENSFFIQGFMGMVWFIYPAVMVICTVLLIQNERTNNGILKMLALPVSTASLCLAKFICSWRSLLSIRSLPQEPIISAPHSPPALRIMILSWRPDMCCPWQGNCSSPRFPC